MKRLAEFCDVTATALLMAGLLFAAYAFGSQRAQIDVKDYCDGLGVVLLAGDRYSCVSMPKARTP